ncbi:MAG TPA: S8 family serine peptidase, partial [Chthoniobacterales bacterium]|nr:S8 family serine peptidase [Chthoniobacterales bacterium]
YGLEILDTIPQLNTARIRYGRIEDLRDSIAAGSGDFASVEGNLWLSIPAASPRPDPHNQGGRAPFGYNIMGAINAAGDRTQWGDNVTVAVLDTGVLVHPTFAEGHITRVDLVNDGQSFHSHGTSVASLIGGQHPQAPGVAPGAQILDIRVANAEGVSVGSKLAEGIIAAADRGAQVINISLGGYGDSAILAQALGYAYQRGAVVVAAAGNDAYGQLAVPAAYEGVISVGSVDADSRQAYFSNAGAGLDLAAPGVGVVSAWDTDKIAFVSGTSQSAALVSAAAATYLAWGVPPNQLSARLKADARLPATSTGAAPGVSILMIKPPPGR